LPHRAILISIVVSLLVHSGLLIAIVNIDWGMGRREARMTDDGAAPQTLLTLSPPAPIPEADEEPVPDPLPPPEPVQPTAPVRVSAPSMLADLSPAVSTSPPTMRPEPVVSTAPSTSPGERAGEPEPARLAASFAGVEAARARRIVYVVDASGGMTTSLNFVKAELARSVARLDPSQSFQVVVFRELPHVEGTEGEAAAPGSAVDVFGGGSGPGALMAASYEARIRVVQWLSGFEPVGRSDPLSGLTAALEFEPDLIFLLTRSIRRSGGSADWGAGNAATLASLDKLNPVNQGMMQRRTVIKAIQFLDEDPTGLLPAIAAAHGDGPGSYRVVPVDQSIKR